MAQKTAFVTGATGFLGLNLVEQLTGAGWAVVALHRATSDLRHLSRFDVERVDLGHAENLGFLHEIAG